jgi:large subunit ribosomal protein L25
MQRETLKTDLREATRKGAARKIRREGKIPAIVYGAHEPSAVSIDAHEFSTKFKHVSENTLITLDAGEKSFDVLIKDYQEDILSGRILHVDFYEFERGKALHTRIPIHLGGNAPGVKEGGIVEQPIYELDVECLPKDIPERIDVKIDSLNVGDAIHVGDIDPPSGVTFLTSEDQVLAQVTLPREEVLEEEEAEEAVGEEAAVEGEEAYGGEAEGEAGEE